MPSKSPEICHLTGNMPPKSESSSDKLRYCGRWRKTLSRKCFIKGIYTNGSVERWISRLALPPKTSHSHMCFINNKIVPLVIARNVLLSAIRRSSTPTWVALNFTHHHSIIITSSPTPTISLTAKNCEFCFKYTRRASYNLLITQVAPNVSQKFQYVSCQTFHSITPGCIHRLQKETDV